ncbi:hypothetical protein [uncultured Sphingomonas sp.]|uniref:hypothetical protein n=1 Tax=uncultured Sphingomonas sp. TaxID=158754 RepID=UPI0025F6DF52|nr:hypothetical protein [uncultured Sphingomonas sp.]
MMADDIDLTGAWKGIFHYPHSLPPGHFDAELRDGQGALIGETFEIADAGPEAGRPLHAMLTGHRQGREVRFVKHYDHRRRVRTPVHYSGQARDGGLEISGIWHIPGHWSGSFLMIRATPRSVMVERKEAVTVR